MPVILAVLLAWWVYQTFMKKHFRKEEREAVQQYDGHLGGGYQDGWSNKKNFRGKYRVSDGMQEILEGFGHLSPPKLPEGKKQARKATGNGIREGIQAHGKQPIRAHHGSSSLGG